MNTERLENYANVILKNYVPCSEIEAAHEIKYNTRDRKISRLLMRIMAYPADIDIAIKERVAKTATQKLIAAYKSVIETKHY